MSEAPVSMLFIGGPWDGERLFMPIREAFYVATIEEREIVRDEYIGNEHMVAGIVNKERYNLQWFAVNKKRFPYFLHESCTEADAAELLLTFYCPLKKEKK